MSNVIPIVSSSPPPLDDDVDFKWDDDDDEYGNFTCAPTVSATTVNSDSSIDTNWSNSKSPGPPHHGSSLGKDTKTLASKEDLHNSESDRGTSENTSTDKLSSIQGTKDCLPVDVNVIEDEDDFQDFAQFDNIDFSEGPVQALGEEHHSLKGGMPPTESPAAPSGGVSSTAELTEEDEFQDFAQFGGDATAESSDSSTSNQPVFTEHSSQVGKCDANSSSSPDSTCDDVHSLGLDLGSDPGAPRADSAGSVPLKSTDSIYSSVSTVDSGVFSTDLSPSYQSGEPCDIYLNTDKEERQVHTHPVQHNIDIFPPPDSLSSARSPDNAPSLEASHEHCKATAALDNIVSKDALEISVVSDHSDNDCDDYVSPDNDNVSNRNAKTDFASCNTADDSANVKDAKHLVKDFSLPVLEQLDTTVASSGDELDYSIQQNEASNLSTVSTSVAAGELGSDDPSNVDVSSNVSPLASASDSVLDGKTPDNDIVDSAVSSEEVEGELEDNAQLLNSNSVNNDVNIECNTEGSVQSNTGDDSQSEHLSVAVNHEKSDSVSCDLSCDVAENSELLNKDTSTCNQSSATDVGKSFDKSDVLESKEAFDDFEDAAEGEDKEFGDFSTYGCQKDEGSSEVAPIMFRTSICETEEVVDDDDFTFDRERPPVFDDGDDDDGEFGAAGTDISDDRNNDDFGEFDAAQKVQPNLSVADAGKNVKDNDDDEFGDFDKSEPVDDGASWADFGSAATPSAASDSLRSSTTKPVVPQASVNQSQVQKLQNAVISCFVVASEGDSSVQQADPLTGGSQESQPGDNSPGGSSLREEESLLPLDMVVDLGLSKALEAKQQTWTLVQHPSKKDPKVRLWAHLKDMDTSHALMYGWHSSHCSKEVYTSLHIDTQNILFSHKKQAVPFFASGLGILEPIRGGGGGVVERKKEKITAPTTQTILLESGRQEFRQSPTVQDIPPVDFDWSSSGLTNPLTANTLDLDFLVIQGGDSSEKTSVFKAEDRESAPPAMQPLEDILKRTTPTVKLATNEVLSPEAVRVLERMPDLSFMQSRVLMFPVKQ